MARILTLTNWYPPHSYGGYEVVCQDVMRGLARYGHDVEILCSNERRAGAPPQDDGFPVHRSLQMYWRDEVPWTPGFGRQVAIERANQKALRSVLDRFRPDVVSVWHMGALSLSLLSTIAARQIPIVYSVGDDWLLYGLALDSWSGRWTTSPRRRMAGTVARRVLGLPTVLTDLGATGCFCFVSEATRARALRAPWKLPCSKVLHHGIDGRLFTPRTPSKGWEWRLLYVGRLDQRKGTHTLLDAMATLPAQATLTMASQTQGEELQRHRAMAATLGLADRVRFESVEHRDIGAVYAAHDCTVFPSEWDEPFGLVPLESMASGTPVVATGVGGSAEFLRDGENCVLFEGGDANALAVAVTTLADDEHLRARLATDGVTTAAQFDIDATIEAFDRAHRLVAEGKTREFMAETSR